MKEGKTVSEQYRSDDNLSVRMRFQGKYSVNAYGFGRWIGDQYAFASGDRILELGCGNGAMWLQQRERLPKGCKLVLSDFSEGMLQSAQRTLAALPIAEYRQIDVQQIPYPDEAFDAEIANMMLYHVPDIDKGLREIRRTLKKGGAFYCATYGENGILRYIGELFAPYGGQIAMNDCFTLQNGRKQLLRYFSEVERRDYADSFVITDADDLLGYMQSLSAMIDLGELTYGEAKSVIRSHMIDGALRVPKEYGLFICR